MPYVFSQEGYFIISYLAINNEGEKKKGKFHGGDRDELISTLRENGYFLLNAREEKGIFNAIISQRYSKKELAVLSSHMYLMINAGVSISETLHIIASMEKKTEIKARLLDIYNGIIKGRELYKCLQLHKDIFPDFFIKMVQLGEYTGNLELILKSLYEYYERDNKIVNKVKSSMTYPVMVFITSMIVIMILMLRVVPQFTDTLKGLGGEMPPVTAVMLNTCAFLRENFLHLIIVLTFASVLSIRYLKTSKGRYKIHSLKLKLPFIKVIYEKILLAKFSRSLSTLLNSGFNIVRALDVCSEVTDNIVFGMKIQNCVEYIKKEKIYVLLFQIQE